MQAPLTADHAAEGFLRPAPAPPAGDCALEGPPEEPPRTVRLSPELQASIRWWVQPLAGTPAQRFVDGGTWEMVLWSVWFASWMACFGFAFFRTVGTHSIVYVCNMFLIGTSVVAVGIGRYHLVSALLSTTAARGTGGAAAATRLDALLQTELTPETARRVGRLVRSWRPFMLFIGPCCLCVFFFTAVAAHWAAPTSIPVAVAVAALVVTSLPAAVNSITLLGLLLSVVCTITADPIHQLAIAIRRTDAAATDYNSLVGGVHRAHRATMELSKLIQVPLLTGILFCVGFALACLIIAVAPRPGNPCQFVDGADASLFGRCWYNLGVEAHQMLFWSTFFSVLAVWSLSRPAAVTTACQSVAGAVNMLRVNEDGAGTVTLVSPEHAIKIECVERLIIGLNRGQGLGVTVLGKRITKTLVMTMMVEAMGALVVLNSALLGQLHLGNEQHIEEQEIKGLGAVGGGQ